MNIEELKQVGEMLVALSGDAFDGYLLWIAHMFFETTAITVLWGAFWVGLFKVVSKLITPMTEKIQEKRIIEEAGKVKNDRLSQFDEIGSLINTKTDMTVFAYGNPQSVTDAVNKIINQNKQLMQRLNGGDK